MKYYNRKYNLTGDVLNLLNAFDTVEVNSKGDFVLKAKANNCEVSYLLGDQHILVSDEKRTYIDKYASQYLAGAVLYFVRGGDLETAIDLLDN